MKRWAASLETHFERGMRQRGGVYAVTDRSSSRRAQQARHRFQQRRFSTSLREVDAVDLDAEDVDDLARGKPLRETITERFQSSKPRRVVLPAIAEANTHCLETPFEGR